MFDRVSKVSPTKGITIGNVEVVFPSGDDGKFRIGWGVRVLVDGVEVPKMRRATLVIAPDDVVHWVFESVVEFERNI